MGAPPLLLVVVKHSNWKRSVSGYGSSEFLGSVAGPRPTPLFPKNPQNSPGVRGVLTGLKARTHTDPDPRGEEDSGPWVALSPRDLGLAPTPVCLLGWGDPSELCPPALAASDRCLGLGTFVGIVVVVGRTSAEGGLAGGSQRIKCLVKTWRLFFFSVIYSFQLRSVYINS